MCATLCHTTTVYSVHRKTMFSQIHLHAQAHTLYAMCLMQASNEAFNVVVHILREAT